MEFKVEICVENMASALTAKEGGYLKRELFGSFILGGTYKECADSAANGLPVTFRRGSAFDVIPDNLFKML
ncbi:hypothetical protein CDAR_257621 [Caerostris darwini]|uniref:Uncharacterized protein n=1 Tax=Caerostris darwini TaxID=1538125 RepID=A0AAV4T9B8_9ARAC|nr:hypothetical protein CDAR_257621 [Caerostris darwini]